VAAFGEACLDQLAGPGDREAAIRTPIETLLGALGVQLKLTAVFHAEVRDTERRVRPDYGVRVNGAITGYIEVKAPGKGIDPTGFTGHDKEQWERQRDLPNLLYTNGTSWRLFRDGDLVGEAVHFAGGDLDAAGSSLSTPPQFETLITDFLKWEPAPIGSVSALVAHVAPLTRLLRGEVLDQLALERKAIAAGGDADEQPFLGLARDWRTLLFPLADDKTFADGYAQTVTFALLLARSEGIDLRNTQLHEVGAELGPGHSLMGKALQLFTDDVAADFRVTLDLLIRVVAAVDWEKIRKGKRDTYLHLYEHFLDLYDNDLRKKSGTYYTPREVVEPMVRLAQDALITRLGKPSGFRDDDVLTLDPATGTGTFLQTILDRAADEVAQIDGRGAVPGALTQLVERLYGFELQIGPYAVAELRITDLLTKYTAARPATGLRLYVTDTLDDPYAAQTQIGSGLQLIAQSRRKANQVKAKADVTVVIGNPPYRERAQGLGGWVENGSAAEGKTAAAILDDFRDSATSQHFHNLKNLYVYFWRWATWKVWESTPENPDGDAGVVCFVSTSSYIGGPGFTRMREYLRRTASEGWIIDLTPEGQTPDVPTRIFPGVRQPLAIGLFVREPDTDTEKPAVIRYRSVSGLQQDKFNTLAKITMDDDGWWLTRDGWTAPFLPRPSSTWDAYPAMDDLMPWTSPCVKGNRRWPYAPSVTILTDRWNTLRSAPMSEKRTLFKETRDRTIEQSREPLPGVSSAGRGPISKDQKAVVAPVRAGYRSFDRQWVIPDSRVLDRPRPDLWRARIQRQIFVIEQHSHPFCGGPGLVFSALIPDQDHFNNRGGRTLPLLHPDGSANVAPGLLQALNGSSAEDLIAYIAAVVAHPGFTATFVDELTTPGVRVPLTADAARWAEALALGREVIWLHTYGAAFAGEGRPPGNIRFPKGDARQPKSLTPTTAMPAEISYRESDSVVVLGDGEFGPVELGVWEYTVGGRNVLTSWFNYRKKEPGGRKTSPLDSIHTNTWPSDWTTEFIDLLTVLTRLTGLEEQQAELLDRILAGPLRTKHDLERSGVRWPSGPQDRTVRNLITATADDPILDLQ
jgi:hypothetical protein